MDSQIPTVSALVHKNIHDPFALNKERPRSLRSVTFSGATVIRITRDTPDDDIEDTLKQQYVPVAPPARTKCYSRVLMFCVLNLFIGAIALVFVLAHRQH